MGKPTPFKAIAIDNANQSDAFNFGASLGFIVASRSSVNGSIFLQVYCRTDDEWIDTGLQHEVSTSAPSFIKASTLVDYIAGGAKHPSLFRFRTSAQMTITLEPRNEDA